MPVRTTRSKTGCQSCRRRKVRCDEHKPVCGACDRLQLDCVFLPGIGPGTESTKFRVRFVQSPYSKRQRLSMSTESHQPFREEAGTSQQHSLHQDDQKDEKPSSSSSPTAAETPMAQTNMSAVLPMTPDTATPQCVSPHIVHDAQQQLLVEDEYASIVMGSSAESESTGNLTTTNVPAFFDLNMNFNLLDDSQLSFPPRTMASVDNLSLMFDDAVDMANPPSTPARVSPLPAPAVPTEPAEPVEPAPVPVPVAVEPSQVGAAVIIPAEDHVLIQHYLNVMSQYNKIRGSGDENVNIYTQIFSNMALFYTPLYSVIMAWTGLHLGQARGRPDAVQRAERRYDEAVLLLHEDQEVAHHFELSLVTIWFALQFELLAARGVEAFCRHLEFTADLVDAHRRHNKAGGHVVPLSHIGARVLIWLGTSDARAAWVGGSGHLLQNLELYSSETDFLETAFPNSESASSSSPAAQTGQAGQAAASERFEFKACLRLTLQFDSIDSRIAQLHQRRNQGSPAPVAIWLVLQSDLQSVQDRLERRPPVAAMLPAIISPSLATLKGNRRTITTGLFNDLLLLSACYSVIISFHQVMPPAVVSAMPETFLSAEEAATRILRISSWVCRLRPPSPQNIWPRILFLAGSETPDPAYQDWVIRTLTDAERWGINLAKTRALLQFMIHRQTCEGKRVDFMDAMRQSTGLFIV